ncbi:MAG: tetratricopeptide repeat protein, partial [Desulfobacteraceae bacterium]|nr:tetratricopeptide repeat protein [Desulfobacteraceae bacterium]
MLAGIFISENSFLQAKESAEAILKLAPDNYQAIKLLGNLYMQENQFDRAKNYFSTLIELAPQNPDGFFLLGLVNKRQQKYEAAVANFEAALAKGHSNINVFVNLVSTLLENNMIDDAIDRCDENLQKIKNQPYSQAVIYDLKGKLYLAQNHITLAEKSFKSAIISNPNYLPPYYSLAKIYFSEGREDKAIRQYENAIGSNAGTRQEMPNMMLGIIFSIKKQWDLAELHYRKALKINPDFVPAANNLAYLLADQDKNLDEALRLAQKAKKILPDDPRIQDTLGWIYVKLGFYEQAIHAFSDSIRHLPDNATLHYHLGMAYYKKGEARQAKAALEQALKLNN